MSKTILALGAIAWLALSAANLFLWLGLAQTAAELHRPLLIGLIACLLLLLSLLWIALYLVGTGRALRDFARHGRLAPELASRAAAAGSGFANWAALAAALAVGALVTSFERIGGRLGSTLAAGLAAGALLAVALVLARAIFVLAARERLLAEVDRATNPSPV
jgi:hypothetical protein